MKVDVIRTKADYRAALKRLETWMRSGKADYYEAIEALATLIKAYEDKHYPAPQTDPIDAIRFRMKQLDWTQNQLASKLGMTSGRLSEIMNLRRPLTLPMIRQIVSELGIPADVLIQPYTGMARRTGRRANVTRRHSRDYLGSS